jgi:UDP-glucuronate decarboxylase
LALLDRLDGGGSLEQVATCARVEPRHPAATDLHDELALVEVQAVERAHPDGIAEALAVSSARQYDVGVRIARLFNTYGSRLYENDGRVVSNFILQALHGEPLTVYGEGLQTRSFCYVDDTIEGVVRLMASEHGSAPVNIGSQFEFTMVDLAKLVVELTGSRSEIVHAPLPADDPKQRRADATRARELLGWEPRVQLRDGLLLTIAYFRQRLQRLGALPGGKKTGGR